MAASLGRSLLYTSVIASSPDRHHQGIGDLPGRYPRTHRPAGETAGEENDDGGHLEPALSRPDVGEAIHLRLGADASKLRSSTLSLRPEVEAD